MLSEFAYNIFALLRSERVGKLVFALVALSGAAVLLTLAAPHVGLGEAEEFLLYKIFSISRGQTLRLSVAFVILLIVVVLVTAGYLVLRQRYGKNFVSTGLVHIGRLSQAGWSQFNRRWVVASALALPAIYVFVFYWTALPDGIWIAPDSGGYVTFSERRTLFYAMLVRLLAIVSDNPGFIAGFQVACGLMAIVFMCESIHRLIRNSCVGILLGLLLLFNWPLFEHSMILLTDYLTVASLCVVIGVFALTLERPSAWRMFFLAVSLGTAIALRPVGVILLVILPVILVVHPRTWKRLVGFSAVPLLAIVLLLVGAQKMVHGSHTLSPSTGYSMGNNTAFLLTPETPVEYPELRDRIVDLVAPLLVQEKEQHNWREAVQFRFDTLNQTIGTVGMLTLEFGNEKDIVTHTDLQPKLDLLQALGATSALNNGFSSWDRWDETYWVWLDRTLADMARSAVRHNPGKVVQDMIPKLLFSWENVIPLWLMPEEDIGPLRVMDQPIDDEKLLAARKYSLDNGDIVNASGFNKVSKIFLWIGSKVPFKYVFLGASVIIVLGALVQLFVYRRLTPAVALLVASVGLTVCYHFAINMGQMPLYRFILGILPASGFVVISVLCLWQRSIWITRAPDHLETS